MRFKKRFFFIIPASTIFIVGLSLFLIGGIGTTLGKSNDGMVHNNGYFSMAATSSSNSLSIQEIIEQNNKKYEDYNKQFINANKENSGRTNIDEQNKILNYYSGFKLNYNLFISGSVLWPISLTSIIIFLLIIIIKNKKNK